MHSVPDEVVCCILEIIQRRHPDCVIDVKALRKALGEFYPWNSPEVVHEHLNDPDHWWAALQPGLAAAAIAAGVRPSDADPVAAEVRSSYATPESFRLYDDTTEALRMFRDAGWTQAIVSNHCPELASLVDGLGIGEFFDKVYSSACTGYEKPHPRSIGLALEYFEVDVAWMIAQWAAAESLIAHFLDIRFNQIRLYPDVQPNLARLKGSYRLGLLSNGNSYPDRCGLPNMFDAEVLGPDLGIDKPDVRAFTTIADELGVDVSSMMHVGDAADDVDGANAAGAVSVLIVRDGEPPETASLPDHRISDLNELQMLLDEHEQHG